MYDEHMERDDPVYGPSGSQDRADDDQLLDSKASPGDHMSLPLGRMQGENDLNIVKCSDEDIKEMKSVRSGDRERLRSGD